MNVLESSLVESPYGKEEECAKFTIDNTENQFRLADIVSIDQEYTLTLWIRADADGQLYVAGQSIAVATTWRKHVITFTATSKSVFFLFQQVGTYYIYHPQLEIGNKSTDWTPAPEDMATGKDLSDTNTEIELVKTSVSELNVTAQNISASVKEVQEYTTQSLDSVNGNIETLTKEVSARMTSEAVELQIQSAMENGTSKVVTSTGYTFDEEGITVEKSGSEMKTQITENGMTVYQNNQEVLTANNVGVDAKNLHATTYMIVGENSRFEDYGSGRTGCFWIGGA